MVDEKFVSEVQGYLGELKDEVAQRNESIRSLDKYIYGDLLEKSLDIPIGHDRTPINWLKRSVSIHKDQFMINGFQITSTYDSLDLDDATDDEDRAQLALENDKLKAHAQQRRRLVSDIMKDNGGIGTWLELAENASAIGTSVIKSFYDKEDSKWVLTPVEEVENFYCYWDNSNYRESSFKAYVWQISLDKAIRDYGVSPNTPTSALGSPLLGEQRVGTTSTREMVTVIEATGLIPGYSFTKANNIKDVKRGDEQPMNVLMVGNEVKRVLSDEKEMPRYYVLPNRRQRNRAWGVSDISDAAIGINQTYIETFSDWRTVSSKVNFPKWKALGFQLGQQIPTPAPRKAEVIPLAADQDILSINNPDAQSLDFKSQLDELKEQFVRETAISPVLFNDPTVDVNSNQALLTTMKPTTDLAEAKKELWGPIIREIFEDALETLGKIDSTIKDLVDPEEGWSLEVRWPSHLPKEDPVFQSNLINRFNSNTISLQTFLEMNGDSSEEIDRIRDELADPTTASILGRVVSQLVINKHITPPSDGPPEPKVNVSLRGELTPYQEANLASKQGFNDGPFPPTAGPQGSQGNISQENADNKDFLTGNPFQGGEPIQRGPDGQPVASGQQGVPQVTPPGANQEGQGVISQPGSGATPVSPEGRTAQQDQQAGR